jgi:hypothetical protein
MPGTKHLIECHCHLAIRKDIYHKFPVYSKIVDDKVISHYEKCTNCGTLHRITEICRSEFISGKEDAKMCLTKDDYIEMLPEKIATPLIKNDADISSYAHALDIIEEKRWGEMIVLSRETISDVQHIKTIEILSESQIKIQSRQINYVAS